jgi:hypothetical protein
MTIDVLRCDACGAIGAGPRDLCPNCHGALSTVSVPGDGRLVSWTMIRRPPTAFKAEGPYAVAVVALDAGCTVTGRLADPSEEAVPGRRVTDRGRAGTAPVFGLI